MEANIHPTEIPLHRISSGENTPFVQQNTGTMAVDQAHFLLVSDKEISEMKPQPPKTPLLQPKDGWQNGTKIETLM